MTIFVEDSFDSAHSLRNVPKSHKCAALHGHTYQVRIEVSGSVDQATGWVIDYADVKRTWLPLKEGILDHTFLNDVPGLTNSTCENIAVWIWNHLKPSLPGLSKIELRETRTCGVVYEGRD